MAGNDFIVGVKEASGDPDQIAHVIAACPDDFAVLYLPRAGYDPSGLPTFFQTMMQEGGSRPPEFLSSHPSTESRLNDTRSAIANLDLPPGLRTNDGGKFEIIQRRVRLLTGAAPNRGARP